MSGYFFATGRFTGEGSRFTAGLLRGLDAYSGAIGEGDVFGCQGEVWVGAELCSGEYFGSADGVAERVDIFFVLVRVCERIAGVDAAELFSEWERFAADGGSRVEVDLKLRTGGAFDGESVGPPLIDQINPRHHVEKGGLRGGDEIHGGR